MIKVRRLGEKNDRTLMRVALSGQSGEQETIICDIEQIVRLHAYGAGTYRKAATDTRKWLSLYGASKRSMTSTHSPSSLLRVPRRRQEGSERVSIEHCGDDKDCPLYGASKRSMALTHSPSSLLRVPRRRQEGSERVSIKLFSDDKDCILYSPANMVALPDAVFELVVAEVKTRTAEDDYDSFNAVTNTFNTVGVCISKKNLGFLSGVENKLARLVEQQEGMFLVTNMFHCVGVDCGRRLIFDCGKPFALKLSERNFGSCKIFATTDNEEHKVGEIRRVTVDQNRYRQLCEMIHDQSALYALKKKLSSLR